MAALQDRLIESLIKDFGNLKEIDVNKALRKECSLIQKRISDAKKIFLNDKTITSKLIEIELHLIKLKAKT